MPHRPIFALWLACTLLAACNRQPPASVPSNPTVTPNDTGTPGTFAFEEADIAGLQARMASGELSSRALTRA
ncbi:MAG: hypothetical protein L0H23_09090, partial [Luteimonas sp.]|nr:hypothetical protein [Luteimonas sp.]